MSENLRAAMNRAGLGYAGPIVANGRLHRFKAEGDNDRNSWYVLHVGPPAAGVFGCWKRAINENWYERHGELSQAEWSKIRRRWQEADRERDQAEQDRHANAKKVAARILRQAKPATEHAYLAGKGVKAIGELRQWKEVLVVPLRDVSGELHSLQFIGADGTKRFLSGGRIAGAFYTVAEKPDGPLVLAEGYATVASIHEATGFATVAAMNCGNLLAVAKELRARWPQREIIVAADDDQWTEGNPGVSKASEAAKAIHATLARPRFKDTASKPTDFNDMAVLEGFSEVKRQLEAATAPKETEHETFARLADLSPADYDRTREAVAQRLGIRVSALDKEVERLRPSTGGVLQGEAVTLPEVEPWSDCVNGAEVLEAAAARYSRYLALPSGGADAMALWTAHAHAFEAFRMSPRLNFCAPEKGCGKSTALDVLAVMAPRVVKTENITTAVLFRLVNAHKPILLLDEVDAYLNEAEELRGLLNAGHKRGAKALRCEGDANTVRAFNAYAPAALAGIGALPGTLHDRSIVIRLVRAKPGEVAAQFDEFDIGVETELCRKLARWTADNFTRLKTAKPKLPSGAFNRLADNWRPLFAIAEVAGGDWPRRAEEAFAKLTSGDDSDVQGVGTMLLADIAAVFSNDGADKLPSVRLAAALAGVEGRPWPEFGKAAKPISPNQLAKLLRRFDVSPRTIKLADGSTAKGYHREDFAETFTRFLPQPAISDRNPVTTPENIEGNAHSKTSPTESGLLSENPVLSSKDGHGYEVTVQRPGEPEMAQADLI